MLHSLVLGGLGALAFMAPAFAEDVLQGSHAFVLAATADTHSYGLWLAAPQSDCRVARYMVTADGARLGFSAPLGPGEGAVIRIGRGFAIGAHDLTITSLGCISPPAEARRVLLGKSSPDHSWLAR